MYSFRPTYIKTSTKKYDVYQQTTGTDYNIYYFAEAGFDPQTEAENYATDFVDKICATCSKFVDGKATLSELQITWQTQATNYNNLDITVKAILIDSEGSAQIIKDMFRSYKIAYSKHAADFEDYGGDFLGAIDPKLKEELINRGINEEVASISSNLSKYCLV